MGQVGHGRRRSKMPMMTMMAENNNENRRHYILSFLVPNSIPLQTMNDSIDTRDWYLFLSIFPTPAMTGCDIIDHRPHFHCEHTVRIHPTTPQTRKQRPTT